MSVTGPQNLLTQNVGVETTSSTGSWAARALATVVWWSSGSGTGWLPVARESMAAGGAPGVDIVRLSLRTAGSPGAGTLWWASTEKAEVADWEPAPATSA